MTMRTETGNRGTRGGKGGSAGRADPVPGAKREMGTIKKWFAEKGFGFIRPAAGGEDVFAHSSAMPANFYPQEGDTLSFVRGISKDGRPRALDVRLP